MGIKFLRLHMIPWCFHFMCNHVSCVQLRPEPPVETIKLIRSDGHVKIYHRPIYASQLMLEYPKCLVCHSDSFFIGQKIPALSEKDELQLGQTYFLLPKQYFQSVLSFVTVASFASSPSRLSSSGNLKSDLLKKAAACQSFDIQKTPSGSLQIRVLDEFISKLIEAGKMKEEEEDENSSNLRGGGVCTTPQLQKDYTRLVGSRQWKPKLETIKESERRKVSSFGMKRRKKSQLKGSQRSQRPEHVHGISTTPSKTKIIVKGNKGM